MGILPSAKYIYISISILHLELEKDFFFLYGLTRTYLEVASAPNYSCHMPSKVTSLFLTLTTNGP